MTPYELAKQCFESYCAMNEPRLPEKAYINLSAIQVRLARWQTKNFGAVPTHQMILGALEEVGELAEALIGLSWSLGRLAHVRLKHEQKIRDLGSAEAFRIQAADAIADSMVFVMQACTAMRLDFGELFLETVENVLKRDWKARPSDAHEEKHCTCSNGCKSATCDKI